MVAHRDDTRLAERDLCSKTSSGRMRVVGQRWNEPCAPTRNPGPPETLGPLPPLACLANGTAPGNSKSSGGVKREVGGGLYPIAIKVDGGLFSTPIQRHCCRWSGASNR